MLKQRLIALGATAAMASLGAHVALREGVSYTPYKDQGGVTTWCYGQTQGPVKQLYTQKDCDLDMLRMLDEYGAAVKPYIKDAPASVYGAFTSTAINIGKSGWRGSQLPSGYVEAPYMPALRAKDWKRACDLLEAPWRGKYGMAPGYKATIGGYPSKGLGNRRAADAAYCRSGL